LGARTDLLPPAKRRKKKYAGMMPSEINGLEKLKRAIV
jgi:hypothetical protein